MHAGVNCVCKVCGSAHSCGCVVNLGQPFYGTGSAIDTPTQHTISYACFRNTTWQLLSPFYKYESIAVHLHYWHAFCIFVHSSPFYTTRTSLQIPVNSILPFPVYTFQTILFQFAKGAAKACII